MTWRTTLLLICVWTPAVGCVGNLHGTDDAATAPAAGACTPQAAPTPMRRLTQVIYRNSVRDLLPNVNPNQLALPLDGRVGAFLGNTAAAVSDSTFSQYSVAAQAVAAQAVADMNSLGQLLPCGTALDANCTATFVQAFGRRVFRRDLSADELQRYGALAQTYPATDANNLRLLLTALFQSPNFLYAPEYGAGGGSTRLAPYEIATRLAHTLWNTTPDAALLDAAKSGALSTDAGVQGAVQRMLADPRAAVFSANFVTGLFDLDDWSQAIKDPNVYPSFNANLVVAMQQETQDFVRAVLQQGGGVPELLASSSFPLTDPLFALYNVSKPAGFVPGSLVPMDPAQRAGLLTQGAFLAIHGHASSSAPILRGKIIRQNLLCQQLGRPPPDANPQLPAPLPGQSTRQILLVHESNASCAACHVLMDHLGFGLENFDGIGQWRTQDGNAPVDAHGDISGTASSNVNYDGPVALAQALARSADVQRCVALQATRYALLRVEPAGDGCAAQQATAAYAGAGGSLQRLLANTLSSRAFTSMTGQ